MAENKSSRDPKFPTWAPAEVIADWKEKRQKIEDAAREYVEWMKKIPQSDAFFEGGAKYRKEFIERESGVRDLIYRLLTHADMEAVWSVLAKAEVKGSLSQKSIFKACVIAAWYGPHDEEKWTPTERARWIKGIERDANALANKLSGTGLDDYLWEQYESQKFSWDIRQSAAAGLAGEAGPDRKHEFQWRAGSVSELLREMAGRAKYFLKPAVLEKPGDAMARRAYFVRGLTRYCREHLGGPRLALVTVTTAVALEDESISERQVARLIQGRNSDGKSKGKRIRRQ